MPESWPSGKAILRPRVGRAAFALVAFCSMALCVAACGPSTAHYARITKSLETGDARQADRIMEAARDEYGPAGEALYWMERGMTLHLAGEYEASNEMLARAERRIEELYTRRIRTEAKALLTNDTALPYEGDPHEQVMIHVLAALNYAAAGEWMEALVEVRKLDHRLNVLADRVDAEDAYREDPFARYVSGILFEAAGDVNNAFIAYRNAYRAYRVWSHAPVPEQLEADLLRTSAALGLTAEHDLYRRAFGDVAWQRKSDLKGLGELVVLSFNGRAPRKESQFLDVPISRDAIRLVLLTKGVRRGRPSRHDRVTESLLYGLNGRVVRVALPRVVPGGTRIRFTRVVIDPGGSTGETRQVHTEPVHDVTAIARKSLEDQFAGLATKAVARAVLKFGLAEGAELGVRRVADEDSHPIIHVLARLIGKGWAVASEEADTRSWRTLPAKIHLARIRMPPGSYRVHVHPVGAGVGTSPRASREVALEAGETRFLIERFVQ